MKLLCIYTPMNPTRPWFERLKEIHHFNVFNQNNQSLFDYEEEEVLLPSHLQKEGLFRGQNVVRHFNQFYERNRDKYEFICKWDDDMILPRNIIQTCLSIFEHGSSIGVGLFQEDYGAPNILMEGKREKGWYGAFSRFYVYRMENWGVVPIPTEQSGDPDNAFQIGLKGKKQILDVPSVHLDHRAFSGERRYGDYRVLLDLTNFALRQS